MLENADDPMWLVSGIILRESSEDRDRDEQLPSIPMRDQLEWHHCEDEPDHRFNTYESLPDNTWSGQPIWECQECNLRLVFRAPARGVGALVPARPMSTRSQLRFVERIGDDGDEQPTDRIAQLYRHSDGYPDSVLRDLHRLHQLLDETGTQRDTAYTAAQFILVDTFSTMQLYVDDGRDRSIDADEPGDVLDPANMEHLDQPLFLLGHGVENPADGIHGDEEFLYVIELPSRGPFEDGGKWTVKVSEHCGFPRWDGPTEEAFERATWQFEGPLSVAVDDLLGETV